GPDLTRKVFWILVSSHDCLGGKFQIVWLQFIANAAQPGANLIHRQRTADNPSRKWQNVVGADAQLLANKSAGLNCVIETLLSHRHIGVLAVDHERLHVAVGDMFSSDDDRRAREAISGEHRCRTGTHSRVDDCKVESRVLYADVFG